NQNNSLLFELLTENVYNFIVFRGKPSLIFTLHHYDTYAAPLARMICTAFTAFVLRLNLNEPLELDDSQSDFSSYSESPSNSPEGEKNVKREV
ncbi:MAG: hypothetical protein J6W02_01105, partial [Bacteroidaceae bacterium]|nr:hypothetical protein [Bacteroidaceae bacterium]